MKSERNAPWLPPLSLLVVALLIWPMAFSPYRVMPFSLLGQLGLIVVLLRAFCYWPPMARWFGAMPLPHRAVVIFLIGGMVLGHYTIKSRDHYPFVAWYIFPSVDERDPVTAHQFWGVTASGKRVRLLVEQLVPSITQIDRLQELDNPAKYPPGTTDHLALVLGRIYNRQHADDPLRQVDLVNAAVRLHPPANESRQEPSWELLKRYDLSSGPSN